MGGFPGDGKLSPAHGDPTGRGVCIGNAVGDWNAGVPSDVGNPAFRRTFHTQSPPAVKHQDLTPEISFAALAREDGRRCVRNARRRL